MRQKSKSSQSTYLKWNQDELFDEKTNTQKFHDTVPLKQFAKILLKEENYVKIK